MILYIQINMRHAHVLESAGTFFFSKNSLHANRCLPYHVLLYIEHGSWDIRLEEQTFTMAAGDVVLMPANIPHFGVSPCQIGTRGMYLHCYPSDGDTTTETAAPLENCFSFPPVVHSQERRSVSEFFSQMVNSHSAALPYKARLCSSLFDVLITTLSHYLPCSSTPLRHRLEELLLQSTDRFLSNQELAKELHTSSKTLERHFKKEVGKTLHQYQTDRKIDSAKELLLSTDDITLCEIALTLGFCDAAHFSHTFKKKTGVSPEHFRKSHSH